MNPNKKRKSARVMLKISLIGILSILSIFGFDDGVIVTDTTPSHMTPGESVAIDITITKAQIESFGKLLINVPEGFIAEEIESQGASFTFANNKAKFIWMTLPQGEVFTVKYMLTAKNDVALGDHTISGIFSYIKNNQRVDYRMTEKIIRVTDESVTDINIYDNSPLTDPEVTPPTSVVSDGNQENINPVTGKETQITCYRTYQRIAPDQFQITLRVVRADYVGFAKIADVFSIDYAVAEGDSDGAVTVAAQGKMKYVWFEVPEVDEFYVTYFLTSDQFANAYPKIDGKLSVVKNGEPIDMPVIDIRQGDTFADNTPPSTINNTEETEVQDNSNEADLSENNTTEEDEADTLLDNSNSIIEEQATQVVTESEVTEVQTQEDNLSNETENKSPEVTEPEKENPTTTANVEDEEPPAAVHTIPNAETGVTYKVQILAAHKTIGKTYFKKRHNYSENFSIENHEGWVKYTTGSFKEYKQARDDRERINSKYVLPGPFVTAYNEGERITVQEALMITKQQWYQ